MSRIPPIQLSQTDAATRSTLEDIKNKIGMVPNLYATFAHSPAALNAYLTMNDALGAGRFTAKERETIALAVGQANHCQYCVSAHTLIGKGAGLSEQELRQARAADEGNALASFAARIVESRGQLSDADIHKAQVLGLDEEAIVELVANVALNILTNYLNHVADTEIDFPVVELSA